MVKRCTGRRQQARWQQRRLPVLTDDGAFEGLDGCYVELAASFSTQHGERVVHGQRVTMGTVRGHGIECVGNSDHAAELVDLVAVQPQRVATAVVALVVLKDAVG